MPRERELATDPTIAHILFDQENLYFGVYYYQDPEKLVISSLNRDFTTTDNDVFGVAVDTWHDHRNGFVFLFIQALPRKIFRSPTTGWHSVVSGTASGTSLPKCGRTFSEPSSSSTPTCCSSSLFDPHYHGVRSSQRFDPGFTKTSLVEPGGTVLTGVIKSTTRLDQHVQTHE